MEFWHKLFLFAILLPLVSCEDPIYHRCEKNFTSNNDLQNNIKEAIYGVVGQTHSTGTSISMIGANGIIIYGLTQCQGDVCSQDCLICLNAAANELQDNCNKSAAARIWYDACKLRYDTNDFLGKKGITDLRGGGMEEDPNISNEFNSTKWQLLNWVKDRATSAENRFAMGKTGIHGQEIILYGKAQCTIDLQGLACMECLEELINWIRWYCSLRKVCYVKTSSCDISYQDYAYVNNAYVPELLENVVMHAPASPAHA